MCRIPGLALALAACAAGFAPAQAVSAKDLREELGAQVKRWGNDGRLIAQWPLQAKDELKAFKLEGQKKPVLEEKKGLVLEGTMQEQAMASLRELRFATPCRVSFDVEFATADAGLFVVLEDGHEDGFKSICFLNARVYSNTDKRFCGVMRDRQGKHEADQDYEEIRFASGRAYPIVLDLKGVDFRASIGAGLPFRVDPAWPHKSVGVAFLAPQGKVTLRNLQVDGQVLVESVRKLMDAAQAAGAAKSGRKDRLRDQLAWSLLEEEMEAAKPSEPCAQAFEQLTPAAAERFEAARKAMEDGKAAGAVAALLAARRAQPDSPVLAWSLGRAHVSADQLQEAVGAFESATKLGPAIPETWRDLGGAWVELGEREKAEANFAKARELDPADPWVHVEQARLHLAGGELEAAAREIGAARGKRPASISLGMLVEDLERLRSRPAWAQTFSVTRDQYTVECGISQKVSGELATRLNRYRRFLEGAFPLPARQTVPCRVWVFDSEESFLVFSDTLSHRLEHTLGVYHPTIKTLLLFHKIDTEAMQDVLFHEAFHQYLDIAVNRAPIWFNEGLAEYYGATAFDAAAKAKEGGVQTPRRPALKRALANGSLVPFRSLMLMRPPSFMNGDVGLHYAQSWAMVHWFKQGGNATARALFDRYVKEVLAGRSQQACFEASFGDPAAPAPEDLATAFSDHLRGLLR